MALQLIVRLTLCLFRSTVKWTLSYQKRKVKLKKSSRSSACWRLTQLCMAWAWGQPLHGVRVGVTLHHYFCKWAKSVHDSGSLRQPWAEGGLYVFSTPYFSSQSATVLACLSFTIIQVKALHTAQNVRQVKTCLSLSWVSSSFGYWLC